MQILRMVLTFNTKTLETWQTRGVSHCGLAISIKNNLKAIKIMETQIFHHAKI
jgi:hypothetical protein